MKYLTLFLSTALSLLIVSSCQNPEARVQIAHVDPLDKVLRETAFFSETEPHADVARGEHASWQFVLRADADISGLQAEMGEMKSESGELLPAAKIGYVGYVKVGRSTPRPSRDRIVSPSNYYPDPILDAPPEPVPAQACQPVWVSTFIPQDAVPGLYEGEIIFKGQAGGRSFQLKRKVSAQVYSPVIDGTRLWVTNWFNISPSNLAHMNQGKPVPEYSDRYWELAREFARTMAEYHQNVVILSPLRMSAYQFKEGKYEIDFSNFDRMTEMFIEEGAIGRIEGGHIGGRAGNWTSPFEVYVPVVSSDTTIFEQYPITEEPAKSFYAQFFPALTAHLAEKGWDSIYLQHLADEPITENIASYVEMAKVVKQLAPGLKVIEACHTKDLEGAIDVWVPQLNYLDEDFEFYQERQAQGEEVWFYTCLAPQEEYANRFIELPLLKTRVLHWLNFRYDIPGYLHWGLNFWRSGDPYDETTGIITESGNVLPGGDAWIVYPGDGKLLSSLRLEAMRDGIVDYELLRMLEEKDPEGTREMARQVVYLFDRYDMHVPSFREKRKKILKELSE